MKQNKFLQIVAALAAPILALSACSGAAGSGDVPGVTDEKIVLGVNADLSGPAASTGIDATKGFEVYFDWLNDNGGVDGRKVEVISRDHGYDPTRALSNWQRFVKQDNIFGGMCFGTPSCVSVAPQIIANKRPHIMISQAKAFYEPQNDYVLINGIPYSWEAAITIDYIEENYHPEKIGVIYQDDDFGRDGLSGAEKAAEHYGIELVTEGYERGSTDFTAQVASLRRKNVEWVLTSGVQVEPAAIMSKIADLGWDVKIGSLVAASVQPSTIALGDSEDFEGFIGPTSWAAPTDDVPGVKQMLERAKKYAPDHEVGTYFIYGYVNAIIYAEGLKKAAEADNLTPEGVVDAWYQIKDLDTQGLYSPISLSREQPFPGDSASILEYKDGAFVKMTEPTAPKSLD
ncbi:MULTISPECIES: ABC transporter substrate-binding protein [unclassified Nocardioides]|uniref:ABC transporter substrate-binding protein n=1 Tax=unclassified Nocardioides TaxID=2615069 RepID=UPI0006F7793C|nr:MULTISPECIES: ABC transporter substrate-binding protein [unclassified Nocardioides]KQY63483.1 hypothetical protein ASD30_00205 [Nocardioides sp. Root140]KRF17565.1 hypothetical protein ASH02_25225 [Nocardioides sp. Soil796]